MARVNQITGGKGARVIFDPVGGPFVEKLAEAAAPGGIIFQYGLLSMQPTPFPLFAALGKGLSIRGYSLMEITRNPEKLPAAKKYVYDRLADGRFKPKIAKTFPICADGRGLQISRVERAGRENCDHYSVIGKCAMEFTNPSDAEIRAILSKPTTVAVVGCSDNPARDSLKIAKLLKAHGFKVIPVNPQLDADALRSCARREVLPRPGVDSRAGRDSGRIPPLRVRAANRRRGDRQRRAHPVVSARRNSPRRSPSRAASRHDSHHGSMPRDRIRAIVLMGTARYACHPDDRAARAERIWSPRTS